MPLRISTTGTPATVVIQDLGGRTFVHPVTDFDLEPEYTRGELLLSTDLAAALDAGKVTMKDDEGNTITTSAGLAALPSMHTLLSHTDFGGSSPADGQVPVWSASLAKAQWQTHAAFPGNPQRFMLGTPQDYDGSGGFNGDADIQFVQVYLGAGETVASMFVFQRNHGSGKYRLGIYGQTTPADYGGIPVSRLAQTALHDAVAGDDDSVVTMNLESNWDVPASGYYWLALTATKTATKFQVSPSYPGNYLDKRLQVGGGTGGSLPSTVGTLTNPAGAIALVGGLFA